MNFKEYLLEAGKVLTKKGIELSRVNKQDFLTARTRIAPLLQRAGIDSYWSAGGAGSFDPSHPYGGGGRDDSGDIDILIDPANLIEKFPKDIQEYLSEIKQETIAAGKKFNKPAGSQMDLQIKASKRELAKYMTQSGFETTPGSLTLKYSSSGKDFSVDLIVRPRSSWELHTHDFTKDPGMRGADLWLKLYPLLAKLASETIFTDPKTGEEKGNLQFSPDRGLVDRDSDKVIADSKNEIAKILLGPTATALDLASLSGIKNKLINQPEKWNQIKQFFTLQTENVNTNSFKILLEGIAHPEDSIFTGGVDGALDAFKKLAALGKNKSRLSLKWDGFPAIIFGWKKLPSKEDPDGQFLFVDKHMYDKMVRGKLDFTTIKDYDLSRGKDRKSLWDAAEPLTERLKVITPYKEDQYFFGDLMWFGMPKVEEGFYVFEPNTVKYKVKIASETGRDISRSVGGIAVHTFISGWGSEDEPLKGLRGLKQNLGVVFLTGDLLNQPVINLPNSLLDFSGNIINQNKDAAERFLSELENIKAKGLIGEMEKFITRMLESNNIATDIVPRFLNHLESTLSQRAKEKLLGLNKDGWLYKEGLKGLTAVWAVWAALTDLKLNIKKQIDTQQIGLPIQARVGEEDAHEGYVFGSGKTKLKLIDRLGFSRANFGKHVSDSDKKDLDAKRQMPTASFCFGRMNPPTVGHKQLMEKTIEAGGPNTFIFLSNTQNAKKDPLDPRTKMEFVKKIYPEFAHYLVTEPVLNPIFAANYLYSRGFRNLTFVAGADRLGDNPGSIEKILSSWNRADIRKKDTQFGPEGREQVVLNFVSSGSRDADGDLDSVSSISASLARKLANEGNEEGFEKATGVSKEIVVNGKTLYQAVREGLGISEEPAEVLKMESFKNFFLARV